MSDEIAAELKSVLPPGEVPEAVGQVVFVETASGTAPNPIGRAIGNAIGRRGAKSGDPGSLGQTLPVGTKPQLMAVTPNRLLMVTQNAAPPLEPTWDVDRDRVAGIEIMPRRQMMARFKIHFDDRSHVAFMTFKKGTAEAFAGLVGRI